MPIDPFKARNQPKAEVASQVAKLLVWTNRICQPTTRKSRPWPSWPTRFDRLQALLPHYSEIEALKLELATDMDHVSPEVRNLLGLATIDLMASANQVAANVADAMMGHEVTEVASDD